MTEKIKVVLSDRGALFVDEILENTEWDIELLLVDDFGGHKEQYAGNSRVKNIITLSELINWQGSIDIDYDLVERCLKRFNVGDYGSRRIKDDFYFSHYSFYLAIGFWAQFLNNHHVDFCMIINTPHGFPSDYILEEVSKQMGIKSFNIAFGIVGSYVIYSSESDELLGRSENTATSDYDLYKIAHYAAGNKNDKKFDSILLNIIYKFTGAFGVRLTSLIRKGPYSIHYRYMTVSSYIYAYRHIHKTMNYVRSLYQPADFSRKYIVYFLHAEPEAVLTGYAQIIDSQAMLIRMISEALPEDWTLYVKEHPDLYKYNTWKFEYHIPVMTTFLTKEFYDRICSFRNVHLLDYRMSATKLIQSSQAVATICGTVMTEAITLNKPILMFAGDRYVYSKCKSMFQIRSILDIKRAIEKISNGYQPDYSDIPSICEKYLYSKDKIGKSAVIKRIKKEII